jgi:hypothetical protein
MEGMENCAGAGAGRGRGEARKRRNALDGAGQSGAKRPSPAQALTPRVTERLLQIRIWIWVRVGGERRVDVARAYGYKDGSAITHLLKRLAANEAVRLTAFECERAERASSVKG